MDEEGDDIEVGCVNVGAGPTCVFATLEDPASVYPDVMSQLSSGLRFRDPQGVARYPVDGSRLADARVRLTSYRPAAHFARRLVIPDIRLGEWAAKAVQEAIH